MKTAASLFHQQTTFGAFGLKPGRDACCMMSDIFRWCVMEADLYELKLCRFLCPLNCATKFSGVPPSSNREMLVFRFEWLAIFFPQDGRPAFCPAFGKNLPIWFLPSGDSLYQPFGFSRQPCDQWQGKTDNLEPLRFSGRWLSNSLNKRTRHLSVPVANIFGLNCL